MTNDRRRKHDQRTVDVDLLQHVQDLRSHSQANGMTGRRYRVIGGAAVFTETDDRPRRKRRVTLQQIARAEQALNRFEFVEASELGAALRWAGDLRRAPARTNFSPFNCV